jgi:hypothetical protein
VTIPYVFTSFRRQEIPSEQNCIGLVRFCSILFDWFDWFENRTHSKIDVRFCSIAEPNRTPIVRLSSIGFLFDFVRLDTPGITQTKMDGVVITNLKISSYLSTLALSREKKHD